MSVKNWDVSLRPREKALAQGLGSLSDSELLALLLHSGTRDQDVVTMAADILKKAGSLASLMAMSAQQLQGFSGIGKAKALDLLACMELSERVSYQKLLDSDVIADPSQLISWLEKSIGRADQEYFIAVFLDGRKRVIGHQMIYKGLSNAVNADPADLFRKAVSCKASAVIVAHNHPSQIVEPSFADDCSTDSLIKAGKLMNIPLIDHVIVSCNDYYSYRQHGIIR